jgi:hypothetical protein
LTRLLDQRAQTLLEGMPGGTGAEPQPAAAKPGPTEVVVTAVDADQEVLGPNPPADLPYEDVEVESSDEPVEAVPEDDYQISAPVVTEDEVAMPDPLTDQGDELQDDEVPPDDEEKGGQ